MLVNARRHCANDDKPDGINPFFRSRGRSNKVFGRKNWSLLRNATIHYRYVLQETFWRRVDVTKQKFLFPFVEQQ